MFLDLTQSQLALRAELRSYFATLISPDERAAMLTQRHGAVYREVVRRMGSDGWLGVGWPAEYGGHGLGQIEQQIFVNEAALADVPLPAVTLQTVGPTLMAARQQGAEGLLPAEDPHRRAALRDRLYRAGAPGPTWPRCAPGRCWTVTSTS